MFWICRHLFMRQKRRHVGLPSPCDPASHPQSKPPHPQAHLRLKPAGSGKKRKKKNEDARNPIGLLRTVSRAAAVACVPTAARPAARALHRSLLPGRSHGQDGGGPPRPYRGDRSRPGALLLGRFGRDACAPWTASLAAYSMAADQGNTTPILDPLELRFGMTESCPWTQALFSIVTGVGKGAGGGPPLAALGSSPPWCSLRLPPCG